MRKLLFLMLLLALASPAVASDGVLEINQTCAVQTGCIDNSEGIGDTPGFPVNIEIPGSYVLTSNLTVSDPNTDGLFIATAPVTIDLNGFEIQGPVNCIGLGLALTCDAGTGRGIRSNFVRSTVVNGSVIKFGSDGIQLGGRSRVERVVVERNGGDGIEVSDDSMVIGCRAYRNGREGINANNGSIVEKSTSASNRLRGISVGEGSGVLNSTARGNGLSGIMGLDGSTISGNMASNNASGIRTNNAGSAGKIISGNSVLNNLGDGINAARSIISENHVSGNGGFGIHATSSLVQGNAMRFNTDLALFINGGAYRDNLINGVTGGTLGGSSTDAGGNVCFGSPACP